MAFVGECPEIETEPLFAGKAPIMISASVDFPDPEDPTRATNSPAAISRFMPVSLNEVFDPYSNPTLSHTSVPLKSPWLKSASWFEIVFWLETPTSSMILNVVSAPPRLFFIEIRPC